VYDPKVGAALSVALWNDYVISGWADGTVRCHACASRAVTGSGSAAGTGSRSASPAFGGGMMATMMAANQQQQLLSSMRGSPPPPAMAAAASGAAAAAGVLAPQLWSIPDAHRTPAACGVTAVQVSNRGHFVATGGAGGEVRVWDGTSRELVSHLKHHGQPVTDLKAMLDDVHLLCTSEDRSWSVWDITQVGDARAE